MHGWKQAGRREEKREAKKLCRVVVHRIDFRTESIYGSLLENTFPSILTGCILLFHILLVSLFDVKWTHCRFHVPFSLMVVMYMYILHILQISSLLLWMMVVMMMMIMNVILYTCPDLARRRYIFMMRPCSLEWSPAFSVCVVYKNMRIVGWYVCKRSQSAGNNHAWKYDIFRIDEYLLKEKRDRRSERKVEEKGSTISGRYHKIIIIMTVCYKYGLWWYDGRNGDCCILHYVAFILLLLLHWALPEWALIFQVGWSFAASVFFG